MQLPTSGPSPHPASGVPYGNHGPPPNVIVQNTIGPPVNPQQMPPPHLIMHSIDGHPMRGPPMSGPMVPGPPPPGHPGPGPVGFYPPTNLESRIYEMNKRIQIRCDDPEQVSLWWDAFAQEFFDDEAQLTLRFTLEDGPKSYTIGRTLIPRYFRTLLEGGVSDLFFVLRYPCREFIAQPGVLRLECERFVMVTRHDKPMSLEVNTEGLLMCDAILEEPMPRIRHWMLEIRNFQEYVQRVSLSSNPVAFEDPSYPDQLMKNVTRQGLTSQTLNYLRLCVILEPMQQLMSLNKAHHLSPRECLKQTLFDRFKSVQQQQGVVAQQQRIPPPPPPMTQPMIMPPESEVPRPAPKRKRSRKGSQSGGATPTGGGKKKNSASPAPQSSSFALTSHVDVMVVGEPSLMGGEYGDEDERLISRLENTQYDPSAAAMTGQLGPGPAVLPGPIPRSANGSQAGFDPSAIPGWSTERRASPSTPQTPASRMGTPSMPSNVAQPPTSGSNGGGNRKRSTASPESVADSAGGASGSASSTA